MKTFIVLFMLFLSWVNLFAQDISISFQPKESGTIIDSIWVTNQRTNFMVKLLGSESLLLDLPTGIDLSKQNEEEINLYPNPGSGDANLVFSTSQDQEVMVSVYNISGQSLGIKRQELLPGQHTFRLKFPVTGVYIVSVLTHDKRLSLKAIVHDIKRQESRIAYAGSENPKILKMAATGKTMDYKIGDILHYSVHSGSNNTIVKDSPSKDMIYSVEFIKCADWDNNKYPVVKIGTQWWMAENLKTTRYNDGKDIPNVTNATAWSKLTSSAYCWYDNNAPANKNPYGSLYNWHTVNAGNLCPTGWHVPSDDEWTTLSTFLGGEDFAGVEMKSVTGWPLYLSLATNSSGFSGLPGGQRDKYGNFSGLGYLSRWWSSTECLSANAFSRHMLFDYPSFDREDFNVKGFGFSIRCVRD